MLIEPDFTDVQDAVDPGIYKVRVKDAKMGEWEKEGRVTKYVNWHLETYDESESKNNGRIIFHNTAINGRGAFRLQQFYKAVVGQTLTKESPSFDLEMLLGKEVEVTIIDGVNRTTGVATGYTEVKSVKAIQ